MAYIPLEDLRFVPSKRDHSSDDLDSILADIPFLTVGILAFCTFTFLALLKRLGITLTILHLSIITAFIASILDLAKILQQGSQSSSIIKAREVGYALSNGLRFIFFWIFVADPPKCERDTPSARAGVHSGNWNAWGFIGLALRWFTLGLSLTAFVLQVVWRLDSGNQYTNPYSAESSIEVILSIIFALKILLNCIHCTIVPRWICMLDYLGFLVSLIFGIVFAAGNIMHLKFTETMVGRFLQGINFYLLVLSSLLAVFMPPWTCDSGRVPPFRPLSPKPPVSSFNISAPNVSTPNLSAARSRVNSVINSQPRADAPSSTKMTEWLAIQGRRLSNISRRGSSQVGINDQLRKQNQAEQGLTTFWENASEDTDVFWKVYGNHDSYLGTDTAQPPATERPKLEALRFGRGLLNSVSSRFSGLDISAPQQVYRRSWQVDSPVFGLNGIIRPSVDEPAVRSQTSVTITGPDRDSDISDLFRKQEELDNSIAALGLLEGSPDPVISPTSSKQSAEPSTTHTRSDCSLSYFPKPPWVTHPHPDNPDESRQIPSPVQGAKPSRLDLQSVNVDDVPFELVPPRMPASMSEHNRSLSLPISETADSEVLMSARPTRFDSQGTQYDVTSFIGNLTDGPPTDPLFGHKKEFSGSSNDTGDLTIASSESLDPVHVATIVTLQQSRQTRDSSPLARMPVISSAGVGMSPATRVALPSRPRLDISQPQPADRQDVNSYIFERPRAVPPVLRLAV